MRILTDPPAIRVVLEVEPGDTVADVTNSVSLFSGSRGRAGALPRELTTEHAAHFVIDVQPAGDRQPFSVSIPKQAEIDANLLALCALYATASAV